MQLQNTVRGFINQQQFCGENYRTIRVRLLAHPSIRLHVTSIISNTQLSRKIRILIRPLSFSSSRLHIMRSLDASYRHRIFVIGLQFVTCHFRVAICTLREKSVMHTGTTNAKFSSLFYHFQSTRHEKNQQYLRVQLRETKSSLLPAISK